MRKVIISFLIGFVIGLLTRCNNQKIKVVEKPIEIEKIKVETLKITLRDTIYLANRSEIKLFKCDSAILKYDFQLNKLVKLEFKKSESKLFNNQREKNLEVGIGLLSTTPILMLGYKNVSLLGGYDIKNKSFQIGFVFKKEF